MTTNLGGPILAQWTAPMPRPIEAVLMVPVPMVPVPIVPLPKRPAPG
jgi:hypothetical protein